MGGKTPVGYPNPFEIAKRAKVQFDSDLSESRYTVVSSMFDQVITFRIKELQAAGKAILAADAVLAKKPNAKGSALLKEAKEAAFSSVLNMQKAADKDFLALFSANKKEASINKQVTALEDYWSSSAKANYARAVNLADQALATAR